MAKAKVAVSFEHEIEVPDSGYDGCEDDADRVQMEIQNVEDDPLGYVTSIMEDERFTGMTVMITIGNESDTVTV